LILANLRKDREIPAYFHRAIKELKENFSKKDPKKDHTELSELFFHPQLSIGNALNPPL